MNYKLRIDQELSLDELDQKIQKGSRFIVYQYCISLFFAITLTRFSPAILIDNYTDVSKYKRKYNTLSSIFGWWGIPWGIFQTIKSFQINKKGGIDVTEDIMLNITVESLKLKEVELKVTNQLYTKPSKFNIKALRKVLLKDFERDYNIRQLIVGLFINTEDDTAPHYVIGVKADKNFDSYIEPIENSVYTQFRKCTIFEIIDLNEDEDLRKIFEKQGELIINRLRTTIDDKQESPVYETSFQVDR